MGRLVEIVKDIDERNEDISVMFSVFVVVFFKAYKPMKGGSFVSIP